MNIKLIISWIKTNAIKILLVVLLIIVLVLVALAFWLKIRGFKITDLLLRLQVANAENELNHLKTKKAVIETKEEVKKEEVKEIEEEIKEEKKKAIVGRLKIKGMTDDEIADRFTELGF